MLTTIINIVILTMQYWLCLFQFTFLNKKYSECELFNYDRHAKVHVFSLSLMFKLWSKRHYRSKHFQQDMLDNLKNVAIPGTGIPLSYFCHSKITVLLWVFFLYPLICFCGSVYQSLLPQLEGTEDEDSLSSTPLTAESNGSSNKPTMYVYTHHATKEVHLSIAEKIYQNYVHNLLHSDDWFTLWRTNCHLVSYHSYTTKSSEYRMEDKWTFLTHGDEMNVPISPYLKDISVLVCKNKLIEGGMGIHFFPNAAAGGNYILQPSFQNASWLASLLPANAPLSTMRIITTSTYSLSEEYPIQKSMSLLTATKNLLDVVEQKEQENGEGISGKKGLSSSGSGILTSHAMNDLVTEALDDHNSIVDTSSIMKTVISEESSMRIRNCTSSTTHSSTHPHHAHSHSHSHSSHNNQDPTHATTSSTTSQESTTSVEHAEQDKEQIDKYIRAESAVLRLGRMNAATDHSSIIFNVELDSGMIGYGTTNSHWYQLGIWKIIQQLVINSANSLWLPPKQCRNMTHHMDTPQPLVTGKIVPNMKEAIDIVTSAHYKMMAEVPIVGWDVAFTTEGIYLLEVNLSCNFFRGHVDMPHYVDFLHNYWLHLEKIEELNRSGASSGSNGEATGGGMLENMMNNVTVEGMLEQEKKANATGPSSGAGWFRKKYKRHSFKQE